MSGPLDVSVQIPALNGSTDYAPPEGTRVVLVGFDAETETLMPVGVGRVENTRVVNDGPLKLGRLDYLGYAPVDERGQAILANYREGQITYNAFIAALTQLTEAGAAP